MRMIGFRDVCDGPRFPLCLGRRMQILNVRICCRLRYKADAGEYGEEANESTTDGRKDNMFIMHHSFSTESEFQRNSRHC